MRCTNCNATLQDGDTFCPFCGTRAPQDSVSVDETPTVTKPRFGFNRKTILAGIGMLLILALLVSIVSGFFASGPYSAIYRATDRTLREGNFTIDSTEEADSTIDGYDYTITDNYRLMFDIDTKTYEVAMYGTSKHTYEYDFENEMILGIYDGQALEWNITPNGASIPGYGYIYPFEEEIELFFEYFGAFSDGRSLKKWLNDRDLSEIWAEVFDEDVDIEDYIDVNEFEKCAKRYLDLLNDKSWLEEHADYTVAKKNGITRHTFKLDKSFFKASLEVFETAFVDEDDYDDLRDELRYIDETVKVTIGIESGYLVSIKVETDYSETTVKFEDIGKTKVDLEDLEDLLDDCKKHNYTD